MPEQTEQTEPASREDALAAAVEWLYRTRQPDTAILARYGAELPYQAATPHVLRLLPAGYTGFPFVIVTSADGEKIEQDEITAVAAGLAAEGAAAAQIYPGASGQQVSFVLGREAHPTLVEAQNRFRRGCPKHRDVPLLCTCGWREEGARHVIMPTVTD